MSLKKKKARSKLWQHSFTHRKKPSAKCFLFSVSS